MWHVAIDPPPREEAEQTEGGKKAPVRYLWEGKCDEPRVLDLFSGVDQLAVPFASPRVLTGRLGISHCAQKELITRYALPGPGALGCSDPACVLSMCQPSP